MENGNNGNNGKSNGKKKVLIVDDDPGLRSALTTFLRAGGFEVTAEQDGDRGLDAVNDAKPDLVILDLKMPGKAGLEVMRDIRENPGTEQLPVILLTAIKDEESKVLGFRSGADDYLVKPFHALELMARIDRLLETRQKSSVKSGNGSRVLDSVPVRTGDKVTFVPRDDIFFIEAAGKYTYVYTQTTRYLSDCSLKELHEAVLEQDEFFRVHRSYLVNLKKVVGVTKEAPGRYVVELGDESRTMIYVSQRRLSDFKELLHLHF